jgi:ABC-type antimicrobial peptide transport system permease subunit
LLASLVIAIITVSWQSIKASRMDPARSLKAD